MAGGGEVIANGSIHWSIQHDNKGKGHKWTNVKDKKHGQKDDVCQHNAVLYGVDPIETHQALHVTLRFGTLDEAKAALGGAVPTKHGPSGMYEIHFDIQAITRSETEAQVPPPNPYAQIRYEWGVNGGTGGSSSVRA